MIAISYRREDSLPVAGRLYDRLEQRFGKENVFMDFDSIPPGVDFRDQIKSTIERSKVVIVVIGPNWLGQTSDGTRRIDDPEDFVRLEVAHALQRDIPVIPVLVNNTPMPKPETLPIDIQALAFRQSLPLDTGQDFRQHAERLMKRVDDIANKRPRGKRRLALAATAVVLLVTIVVIWKACIPPPPGPGPETTPANTTPVQSSTKAPAATPASTLQPTRTAIAATSNPIATPESSATPSTDRDKPTALTSNEISGKGVGKDISYYYTFNAEAGEVKVTVRGKIQGGALSRFFGDLPDLAIEISDLDANKLFYVKADLSAIGEWKVAHFQFDHPQQVIMRVLLGKHTLDYMVRVEGTGFSPATKVQGPQ